MCPNWVLVIEPAGEQAIGIPSSPSVELTKACLTLARSNSMAREFPFEVTLGRTGRVKDASLNQVEEDNGCCLDML